SDGLQLAEAVWRAARLAEAPLFARSSIDSGNEGLDRWNRMASCLTFEGLRLNLRELAALVGDAPLYQFLSRRGVPLPVQELRCEARLTDRTLALTRLHIDPASGRVDVMAPPSRALTN
ncbi:MAG: hypothetical protein WAV91_13380, partial [Aquabacterium sp.]